MELKHSWRVNNTVSSEGCIQDGVVCIEVDLRVTNCKRNIIDIQREQRIEHASGTNWWICQVHHTFNKNNYLLRQEGHVMLTSPLLLLLHGVAACSLSFQPPVLCLPQQVCRRKPLLLSHEDNTGSLSSTETTIAMLTLGGALIQYNSFI